MITPTKFKKAFEAYMTKPDDQRSKLVEDSLKTMSDFSEKEKAEVSKSGKEATAELAGLIKDHPLSDEVKLRGKELQAELAAALKREDYTAAKELQIEIKAVVTDATGATATAVKDLMEARNAKADAANKSLKLPTSDVNKPDQPLLPKDQVPKVSADKVAAGDKANKTVSDLMAARGAAVEWQKDEIAGVDRAVTEHKRLADIWTGLLHDIEGKRAEVTAALAAQQDTEADIQSLMRDQAGEEETKKEAEELFAQEQDETKKAKWEKAVQNSVVTIAKIQQDQADLLPLQAKHPALVAAAQTALDQTVDAAQATLTREAARISDSAKAAAPTVPAKKGMTVKNPDQILANLGMDMTPVLDVAALKRVGTPIDTGATAMKAVFPDLDQIAEKHGSGRHGTQTGLDRQAARTRSGLTPDQPGDEGGIAKADDSEPFRYKGTETASVFLSPEMEKQAVDTAIQHLATQCPWTEYQDGAAWKKLDNVVVRLGPPPGKAGWGVAIERIDGDGKTDPNLVKSVLADFHNGKISFDKMLKDLNAQVGGPEKKDENNGIHMNVNFVGGVFLAMKKIGQGWTSVTHYPIPPENLGWDLTGKNVRLDPTVPAVVAPAMAP